MSPRTHWLNLPIGTPFEVVAVDLFGPLVETERGNSRILVMIDHHTRWVELAALSNITAETTAKALFEVWISRWGTMRALLSDNGSQFNAALTRQLCKVLGVK